MDVNTPNAKDPFRGRKIIRPIPAPNGRSELASRMKTG
jgi:hypothetical protein